MVANSDALNEQRSIGQSAGTAAPGIDRDTTDQRIELNDVPCLMQSVLCDSTRMPPFVGPWFEALTSRLRSSFPQLADAHAQAVVGCFVSADRGQVGKLFLAIRKASEQVRPADESARTWAHQLTLLAATRCIKPDCWNAFQRASTATARNALVGKAATSSKLIACIGVAGLLGQVIEIDGNGIVALDHVAPVVELRQRLLGQIYDQICTAPNQRRGDANAPLTSIEEGRVRTHFRDLRDDGKFGAIVLRVAELDAIVSLDVAAAINATVIEGSPTHADFVHADTGFTVGELEAELERLLGMVPAQDAGAHVAISQPKRGCPDHEFHVFISYASEDRTFVSELQTALEARELRVWRDRGQLTLGDNLVAKVNEGLSRSRFAVVVLSRSFLAKSWPMAELNARFSQEMNEQRKSLLPVLLDIDHASVSKKLPLLSPKLTIGADAGTERVAAEIQDAIDAARREF